MVDLQLVLRIAGIAALVVSVAFVALAVQYYLSRDIRGVMDDLSGKTRARGVASGRGRTASARRTGNVRRPAPESAPVRVAPDAVQTGEQPAGSTFAAAASESDSAPKAETFAPVPAARVREEADSGSTVVFGDEGPASSTGTSSFRVTRSIVLVDCDRIITAEGERLA